ncbi:hypothetical protein M7784_00090 [Desulfovibrio aminophilus]|nr:hypothetical protein [Desulfovibrio aminophilus]MCM0753652.1 hypothetical protein [Desulfovibrio aminophilus]
MSLTDYQDALNRLQKALGRAYLDDPLLLNVPGRSVACKVDPQYYLALQPAFVERLAKGAALLPATAAEVLVRTGNLITRAPERQYELAVPVVLNGRVLEVRAAFVDADFVDRALRLYAGLASGLEVSDLRIAGAFRASLEPLFENKTPLRDLAFQD